MNGPILLLGIFIAILLFKKYSTQAKKVSAGAGKVTEGMRNPLSDFTNAKGFFAILLLLAGAAIVYWGLYAPIVESPHLSEVGTWSWLHWLPLLLLWGIVAVLINLYTKNERSKKTLQKVLAGVVFMLFVGASIIGYFSGTEDISGNSLYGPHSEIPLANAPRSSWPKLTMPAGGVSPRIAVPPNMHVVMIGNEFLLHNVYQDGHECTFGEPCINGPLAAVYATNQATETNIISYAFAPN